MKIGEKIILTILIGIVVAGLSACWVYTIEDKDLKTVLCFLSGGVGGVLWPMVWFS